MQVAQVEAKQAEKTQEVRLDKTDLFEKAQLAIGQAQFAQLVDLFAYLRQIGAQVFAIAAAKLPFDVDVGIVVQHGLHHAQLVEIRVEQVLHDAIGEGALAHKGLRKGRAPSTASNDAQTSPLCQPFSAGGQASLGYIGSSLQVAAHSRVSG
ncbi:hypothetical protein D9M73_236510 [compost metagenome]